MPPAGTSKINPLGGNTTIHGGGGDERKLAPCRSLQSFLFLLLDTLTPLRNPSSGPPRPTRKPSIPRRGSATRTRARLAPSTSTTWSSSSGRPSRYSLRAGSSRGQQVSCGAPWTRADQFWGRRAGHPGQQRWRCRMCGRASHDGWPTFASEVLYLLLISTITRRRQNRLWNFFRSEEGWRAGRNLPLTVDVGVRFSSSSLWRIKDGDGREIMSELDLQSWTSETNES